MTTSAALVLMTSVAAPVLGAHSTAGPAVTPTRINGNPSCATIGLGNEFKVEPVTDGTKTTTIAGIGTVSVVLDVNESAKTFTFDLSDNVVALAVLVKGGPAANLYDYRPGGINHDDGLRAPNNAGLSHISFCLARAQATLDIQKTPDDGSIDPGDTAEFTLTVTNTSGVTAESVTIEDTLPSGFTWTDDSDSCTITNGNELDCAVGSLAPGGTFSVTVSAPTDADDCGTLSNPDATVDAGNAEPDTDSGSITVECGAISIVKTAKHKDASGDTGPNLVATFTIDDAGEGDPVQATTDEDGLACVDGLTLGTASVSETGVPSGYLAPADQTVIVTEGSCEANTAVEASFENTPLTDVDISIDSQVQGATETVITCTDEDGNEYSETVSDGTLSIDDLPPQTLNCTILIDP